MPVNDRPLRKPDTAFTSSTYRSTQKPKRKRRKRDGIDKLEAFLDEYSPQMAEPKDMTKSLVALINSLSKNAGQLMTSTVNEDASAYGNKTVRGNLGPKVVDHMKEKEKYVETDGDPDEYVLMEQGDFERRVRGYKEDAKKQGPENNLDSAAVGSGTVDVAKQYSGWDWKGQQGEYKRGAEKDEIDDNPEIEKDTEPKDIDSFISDILKSDDGAYIEKHSDEAHDTEHDKEDTPFSMDDAKESIANQIKQIKNKIKTGKYEIQKADEDYVDEIQDEEDIKILTRDADEHRGTYTGNNAAYNYTQKLAKAEDIDDLKWTDTDKLPKEVIEKINKPLKLFNLTTNEIDAIELPDPFPNGSKEVKAELGKILTKHRNFQKLEDEGRKQRAIDEQDDDLDETFVNFTDVLDIAQKNKINLTKEKLQDLIRDTRIIVMRQKMKFDRPRPKDLTDHHNVDMVPEELKTSKTPSYPSGHAFQSHIIAKALSEKYPEYKDRLLKLAEEITENRVIAGVHFPSDSKAGILLAEKVYDKLDLDKLEF
tara:strand:- start:561 stop:2171 length:1611 start_codon:yes stop_codon:yes gene_type:complete